MAWLDTLRGLAVLGVFLVHIYFDVKRHLGTTATFPPDLYFLKAISFGVVDLGKVGVGIFFLISGFLIPASINTNSNKWKAKFIKNRIIRLYPMYWVSIIVYLALMPVDLSATQIALNVTMLQRFIGVPDLNGVYWTLQIELIFYGLCVLFARYYWLKDPTIILRTVVLLGIFAVILSVGRSVTGLKLPVALPIALQLMFMGAIWSLVRECAGLADKNIKIAMLSFCFTLLISTYFAYSKDFGNEELWYRYFFSYLLAGAIFLLFSIFCWHNVFLNLLGQVSYSFYLVHSVLIHISIDRFFAELGTYPTVKLAAISLALTMLVSLTTYYGVEKCVPKFFK